MHRELQVSSCFCSEWCRAAGPQYAAGMELQSELHDASTSPLQNHCSTDYENAG